MDDVVAGCAELPESLPKLVDRLAAASDTVEYDAPLLYLARRVSRELDAIWGGDRDVKMALIALAHDVSPRISGRWLRRLCRDRDYPVRVEAETVLAQVKPFDRTLPDRHGRDDFRAWPLEPLDARRPWRERHRGSSKRRGRHGLPDLETVADLETFLGLKGGQLAYLLTATAQRGDTHPQAPYSVFTIPKRDGRRREICAPGYTLRRAQQRILHGILDHVPPNDAAHAFVKGRSVATNAAVHVGRALVVKFDLVDFFPSIHYARVGGLFASLGYDLGRSRFSRLGTDRSVAPTLARLCCYAEDRRDVGSAYAPQGAPTSPAISNLVCRNLDRRLNGLARSVGARYTRYADDLSFSFDAEPDKGLGRFRWWVDEIVQSESFRLNSKKFRVLRRSQRQTVTGLVVNDLVRIPRRERRRFRAILHNCEKHGVASQARGRQDFPGYLRGFASWVNAVDPAEGRALLDRVDALLGADE